VPSKGKVLLVVGEIDCREGLLISVEKMKVGAQLPYCTVLYSTVLYYTLLYCTILYCTVVKWSILYCAVLLLGA
jgi:hypothetical protein